MPQPANHHASGGLGFIGALTITFITLKLCGVISWPWWWVLAPLWGSLLLVVAVVAFGVLGIILFDVYRHWDWKRRNSQKER